MNYAYARVSAKDQNLQRQIAALDNLVIKVFVDDGYATVHIKLGNATEVADIRLKEVKIALEHLLTSVQTITFGAENGIQTNPQLGSQKSQQARFLGRGEAKAERSGGQSSARGTGRRRRRGPLG